MMYHPKRSQRYIKAPCPDLCVNTCFKMRGIIIFLSFLYIYSFSCIEKKDIIGYNHNKDCAQYNSAQQKIILEVLTMTKVEFLQEPAKGW
jgi:hypothetical protein